MHTRSPKYICVMYAIKICLMTVRRIKRYQQFETIINCTLSDYQKINEIIILQNRVET